MAKKIKQSVEAPADEGFLFDFDPLDSTEFAVEMEDDGEMFMLELEAEEE